jgi:hypothetical protein
MRVFLRPDGGWVVESDRVEEAPMGYRLPELAHELVHLDAQGRVVQALKPHVWSDAEVLGCTVWAVRGTMLVDIVWSRIDGDTPGRWESVIAEGLVEVPLAEFPFRAAVEEALRPS